MDLSQIYIYRMTHIENVPHILKHGITHKNSPHANSDYVAIGDNSLIDARATKSVNISNGNRSQSFGNITLGDFIPFYFGVRMPMLFVIQRGLNGVKMVSPENVVYITCKLSDIIQSGITCYFSDRHAIDAFALFYDLQKITNLPTIINWEAVKSSYWGGEENLETKKQKEAEFLVADDIPPQYLYGFVCYNETAKQRLIEFSVDKKIKVYPQAYY